MQLDMSMRMKRPSAGIIAGLALVFLISLGTYFATSSYLESDIKRRVNSEALDLETIIVSRLDAFLTNLYGARAVFDAVEHLSPRAFQKFIEDSSKTPRLNGLRSIAMVEVFRRDQIDSVRKRLRVLNPKVELSVPEKSSIFSAVVLVEPLDAITRQVVGLDATKSAERMAVMRKSANEGQPILTAALETAVEIPRRDRIMHIFLPMSLPHDGPIRAGDRWIVASFYVQEFFHSTFGAPSLDKERVSWRIESLSSRNDSPPEVVYDRFDAPDSELDKTREVEKIITILSHRFRLTVAPMVHFVPFWVRIAPAVIAFLMLGLGLMALFLWQSIRRRKLVESETSESLAQSHSLYSQQASHLELVNKFTRSVAEEMNEESLLGHFLATLRLAQIDFAYLYSVDPSDSSTLNLHSWAGLDANSGVPKQISRAFMKQLMANRLTVTKEQQVMGPSLGRLLGPYVKAADWTVAVIPTRQLTDHFLLVVGNLSGRFTKLQRELLDNVISHVGLGIDKIHLVGSAQLSNRAKSAFLANMSHEIRTPLNALMGFSEMLASRKISDDRRQSIAAAIRKNSEYLTTLIDDVLDLSKIEAGKLKIHHRRIRLASFLQEVKSVIELKAKEKDLKFEIIGTGALPSHVFVDDIRLKQILLNVLGNAIKFTMSGSVSMAVSCRRRRHESGELIFYVEDSGVGISDEAQTQLFTPFSQGDESTTRRFGGSGLGLALSARLANELGGSLKLVRSIKDVGSVFEIVVPAGNLSGVEWHGGLVLKPTLIPDEAQGRPAKTLDGYRVLLVEDSVDNQEIFTYFLQNAGAEVSVVENGAAAVALGSSGKFDLILMDIQIPGIDGKEATRRLRSMGCMTTIVALTAHALREERDSCLQAGCDGQITKPVGEKDFIEKVAAYLAVGRKETKQEVVAQT